MDILCLHQRCVSNDRKQHYLSLQDLWTPSTSKGERFAFPTWLFRVCNQFLSNIISNWFTQYYYGENRVPTVDCDVLVSVGSNGAVSFLSTHSKAYNSLAMPSGLFGGFTALLWTGFFIFNLSDVPNIESFNASALGTRSMSSISRMSAIV